MPRGIGIVGLHSFDELGSLLAEVLLVRYSVGTNDKRHYTGRTIVSRVSEESKTSGHFSVGNVVFGAAGGMLCLTCQNLVEVAAEGRMRAVARIALRAGFRHLWPDGAHRFAVRRFPIK